MLISVRNAQAQPFYMNMEISERVDTPRRSPTGNASRARAPGGARARRGVSHTGDLQYDVDDIPPWYLSLLLGFQVGGRDFQVSGRGFQVSECA